MKLSLPRRYKTSKFLVPIVMLAGSYGTQLQAASAKSSSMLSKTSEFNWLSDLSITTWALIILISILSIISLVLIFTRKNLSEEFEQLSHLDEEQ